jgi:hypothetical protein
MAMFGNAIVRAVSIAGNGCAGISPPVTMNVWLKRCEMLLGCLVQVGSNHATNFLSGGATRAIGRCRSGYRQIMSKRWAPWFWNTVALARLAWFLLAVVFAAYACRALADWRWPGSRLKRGSPQTISHSVILVTTPSAKLYYFL